MLKTALWRKGNYSHLSEEETKARMIVQDQQVLSGATAMLGTSLEVFLYGRSQRRQPQIHQASAMLWLFTQPWACTMAALDLGGAAFIMTVKL